MKPKRKIRTLELIKDFRSGLTDPELMHKHSLTKDELKEVFKRLVRRGYLTQDEFSLRPLEIDDTVMIDIDKLDL